MTSLFRATGVAIALSFALPAPPVFAAGDEATQKTIHHKRHVQHSPKETTGSSKYPALEPYRSMDFKGEYPGDCAYMRAAGNCMIDLGYGRCEPCNITDK